MFKASMAGIGIIDTGYLRCGFDASYLLVEGDSAVFIETGTSHALPRLLEALQSQGIAREQVAYVMVTHIHLDHAGGAGALLRELPNARLVVHPRGAPHMIDPAKLIMSAKSVYGAEAFDAIFGEIVPVAAERVIEAPDGFELVFNGRRFVFIDTPGHARHHYTLYDEKSRGMFTGDIFGLSFREFDNERGPFIFPTTSPVQFDPAAMHASLERLMTYAPQRMFLTHYGMVEQPARLAAQLHTFIDEFVALAEAAAGQGEQRHAELVQGLRDLLLAALQRHGCQLDVQQQLALLEMDIELNAQGLEVWLERRR